MDPLARPPVPGGAPREHLTPKEATALRDVSTNVWRARAAGAVGGAALTYFGLKRANKLPPTRFRAAFITVAGAFVGSFALMPLGVFMSRAALRDVEDPSHLVRVIRQQLDNRQSGGPLVLQREADALASGRAAPTEQLGEGSAAAGEVSAAAPPAAPAAPQSRWDELRRNNAAAPSAWEHLRQENARRELRQQSPAAAPAAPEPHAPADPAALERERARREYEAAFERERRGIDTPMEGDMAWRT